MMLVRDRGLFVVEIGLIGLWKLVVVVSRGIRFQQEESLSSDGVSSLRLFRSF